MSATLIHPERAPAAPPANLKLLSAGFDLDAGLFARLAELASLPQVDAVLALPDVHQKAQMEVPSSLAITMPNTIVPEFTSTAINDGMGIIRTDLEAGDFTPERIEEFFLRLNAHTAAHPLDANRYSLSAREVQNAILQGGRAAVARYGLDAEVLDRLEGGGQVPVADGADPWRAHVPLLLRDNPACRSEMGLNFGGNHFLEIQVVDRILDEVSAERWGVHRGQIVIMYHLGPGPFGGLLMHHFARREKLRGNRAPFLFASKLLYHYVQRRDGAARHKWGMHFRKNGLTFFEADSPEGERLRHALAMTMNFGFAYRLATVAAVRDALREVFFPGVRSELLCDVPHNSILEEPWRGGTAWVARHNSCRLSPGEPAIVAGSYDVPSYLARGEDEAPEELHSYDHGAGQLIDTYRESGRLTPAEGTVTRLRATRGARARVRLRDEIPVRTAEPIDRLMDCLARHRIVRGVARLRPLGSFKN